MQAPTLDTPGLDTALARALHAQGAIALPALQGALAEVRAGRAAQAPTLARTLVARGVLSEALVLGALQRATASHPAPFGPGDALPPDSGSAWGPAFAARGWAPPAGGAQAPPGAAPRRLGDYQLETLLGQGGMGAVWRGRHLPTGAARAVKTLLGEADLGMRARFEREGAAQATVDAHPNVVRVHQAGVDGATLFLVMDLAEGGSLEDRLRRGPLAAAEAARVCLGLARGLAHCHERGVLHRDLKPANVLFDAADQPRLVDFGLATLRGGEALTRTGDVMGTPSHMAPEQAQGDRHAVDERTDVYGLGAILYHALTGQAPFGREGSLVAVLHAVSTQPPVPPRALRPEIPAALEAICLRALAKSREQRHPSAAALGEDLERYLAGEAVARSGRRPAAALLALAAAGVLALVAVAWWRSPDAVEQPAVAEHATRPGDEPRPAPAAPSLRSRVAAALEAAALGDDAGRARDALKLLDDADARALAGLGDDGEGWREVAAALAGSPGASAELVELLGLLRSLERGIGWPAGRSGSDSIQNQLDREDDLGPQIARRLRRLGSAARPLRLRSVVTLARAYLDVSVDRFGTVDLVQDLAGLALERDEQQIVEVARATARLVDAGLDDGLGAPQVDPRGAAAPLPAPFEALARTLEAWDSGGRPPAGVRPADVGQAGAKLLRRIHGQRRDTDLRQGARGIAGGDPDAAVAAWLRAGAHADAVLEFVSHLGKGETRAQAHLGKAAVHLAVADVTRAREALAAAQGVGLGGPNSDGRLPEIQLQFALASAECALLEGSWRAAQEALEALAPAAYDTGLGTGRWTLLAWVRAARGHRGAEVEGPLQAAREREGAPEPTLAWLPWRSAAATEALLAGGAAPQDLLRRALFACDDPALAPEVARRVTFTKGEQWLWTEAEPRAREVAGLAADATLAGEPLASLARALREGGAIRGLPGLPAPRDPLLGLRMMLQGPFAREDALSADSVQRGRTRLAAALFETGDREAARRWLEAALTASHASRQERIFAADLLKDELHVLDAVLAAWRPLDRSGRGLQLELLEREGLPALAWERLREFARDDPTFALRVIEVGLDGGLGRPPDPAIALEALGRVGPLIAAERAASPEAGRFLLGMLRAVAARVPPELQDAARAALEAAKAP